MDSYRTIQKRSTFNTLLAWIFAILFIISAIGMMFSFFPIGKLLNAGFYQNLMLDVNIYERFPEAVARQLAVNLNPEIGESDSRLSLVVLSDREWEAILVDLINPAWLQTQTEQVIDQVFEVLLVSPDPVNTPIQISVSQIKEAFAGPEGIEAVNQIIAAQPPCTIEQLVGLAQVGLGMEHNLSSIICRPPDFILSEINPFVESILSNTVEQIPDTISFSIPLSQFENQASDISGVENSGEIPRYLQRLRQLNTIITWSPLLPLVFLLLMTLAAVRSFRDFMVWWGGTFLSAGAISLIFSAFLFPAANWALSQYTPVELFNSFYLSDIFVQLGLTDLFVELVYQLRLSIIIPAALMTVFGLALLLGVFLLSKLSPEQIKHTGNSDLFLNSG